MPASMTSWTYWPDLSAHRGRRPHHTFGGATWTPRSPTPVLGPPTTVESCVDTHPAPPNRATVLLRWMVVCPGTAAHRHRLLDRIGKALTLARLRTDSRTSPRPSERVDLEVAGNPQDVPLEREGDVASRRVADGLAHGAGGRHARSRSAARALRPHASRRPPPFASPHRCKRRSSRPRRGSRAHASSCVRIHNARRDRGVDPSRGLFQQHACGSTSRSPHGSVQPACKARPGDDVP